ncbi:MAG: hypothetical protein K0B05_12885 [Bacteroidales bacterium]|nr:hypothetical protein [Bacteroidales bacterium]
MKNIIKIILLLSLSVSFSCEEAGLLSSYCNDCVTDEPLNVILDLKISEEKPWTGFRLYVYSGDLEDGILLDYFDYPRTGYVVSVNRKYTFVAEYTIGATYMIVNSVTPGVRYYKELCDDPCYYVTDRNVDLRLKYYKK